MTAATPVCAWCFEPLGDLAEEFNDGLGHPECARRAYEIVAGPDPMPWPRRRFYRDQTFYFERLGREAGRLGLNPQKVALAAKRAANGT